MSPESSDVSGAGGAPGSSVAGAAVPLPAAPTDRGELAALQLAKLRLLLRELAAPPENRFYAPILKQAGVTADIAKLSDFTANMPLTIKPQLADDQQAHPPFGTNHTYALDHYTRYHQTSGTTRAPIRWLDTPASWATLLSSWRRVLTAAAVEPGDRLYFAFGFGPFLGFWTAFEAAVELGCLAIPGGSLSSSGRLRAMTDTGADTLCCTPTYALRLAEVAAQEGVAMPTSIRSIIVAGEPGGSVPTVRQRIEQAWPNAHVFDHHGMTEVGPVSYQYRQTPGFLYVIESAYLAECLDPATGEAFDPASHPGRVGELVLTTLDRVASPLLRYRTGDLVQAAPVDDARQAAAEATHQAPAQACCDLALDGGILGRVDDMVVVRGVNIYPAAIDQVVRQFADVAEYRVEIRTVNAMADLTLRVEPARDAGDAATLARQIQAALRDTLSLRVNVERAAVGELPRFEMKAKRWVRL